ncbi:MAG: SCO family protein [Verrucomicrobiota bacterium]
MAFRTGILMPLAAVLVGCGPDESSSDTAEKVPLVDQRVRNEFQVKAIFHELRYDDPKIWIMDHETIPGYMERMVMPFHVKEGLQVEVPERGTEVSFRYTVDPAEGSWIEDIKPTGRFVEVPEPEPIEPLVPLVKIGEKLEDFVLTDQRGVEVELSDFRGKAVVITFIFVSCPVPDFCPAMMRNFALLQQELVEAGVGQVDPDEWHLLTISFDPTRDTPEMLRQYGEAYGANEENWSLLSTVGHEEALEDLAGRVGLKYRRKDGTLDHNLRTLVLDRDGRVVRLFTDETWEVEAVLDEIKRITAAPDET